MRKSRAKGRADSQAKREAKKRKRRLTRETKKLRNALWKLQRHVKRATLAPFDGFGPRDEKNLRRVIRQAWSWSTPHRLVVKRCTREDGFQYCENPKCPKKDQPVPKIFVDHIVPCGAVREVGFLERTFVPSAKLQGWCKACHDAKTKKENEARREQAATASR